MPPHVPASSPYDPDTAGTATGLTDGSDATTAAARPIPGWDGLTEQERRRQLDVMDPVDVRSMAASQPVIEQAKGVLMGCFGCDAAGAFAILVRAASRRNVKLREVAALVLASVTTQTGSGRGATSPSDAVRDVLADDGQGARRSRRAARERDEEPA